MFDFRGTDGNQLSFAKDDRIAILGNLETGWWRGELNGKVGHFPGSYVKEEAAPAAITPSASSDSIAKQPTMKALAAKTKAIAVHKYTATDDHQLSFEPNEEITVLAKVRFAKKKKKKKKKLEKIQKLERP